MSTAVSIEAIKTACKQAGFEIERLEQVEGDVFKGAIVNTTFDGSKTAYIKRHPLSREQNLKRFAAIAEEVGHPHCRVLVDTHAWLLMAPAPGRPLSQLLPVVLFPLVWATRQHKYADAYRQLGRQLGTAHDKTSNGVGPALTDTEKQEALDLTSSLKESETKTRVSELFETADQYETPYATTYGDRTPHNLYFDGTTLRQIDYSCKLRSTAFDTRSVIMGVRLMCRRLPYAPQSATQTLETAFWNGYSQTGPEEFRTTAFRIRYMNGCLKLLDRYEAGPENLRERVTGRVDRPILYSEIQRMIDEIDLSAHSTET